MASASESDSGDSVLIEKENARSVVWNYFGFETDGHGKPKDPYRPTCKRCRRIVPVKGANTTNLAKHLQDRHQDLFKQFKEVGNFDRVVVIVILCRCVYCVLSYDS